jgi:hypothetical protein
VSFGHRPGDIQKPVPPGYDSTDSGGQRIIAGAIPICDDRRIEDVPGLILSAEQGFDPTLIDFSHKNGVLGVWPTALTS